MTPGVLARCGRVIQRAGREPAFLLAAPSVALFMVFFLAPLAWMLRLSTYEAGGKGQSRFYELGTFTLSHFAEIFRDPFFLKLGGVTLQLGLMITAITMAIAIPFAVYIHRSRGMWKRGLILAVILPKLTNLLVLMYGVLLMLGDTGYINQILLALHVVDRPLPLFANLAALLFGEVLIVLPYPILMIIAALESVDPSLEEAARSLGGSPVRAYYEAVLKLVVPALVTSTLITFIWGLGAFIAPTILGSPDYYTIAVEVYSETLDKLNWPLGAALSTTYVAFVAGVIAGVLWLQARLSRRWVQAS
jgi:ABC-type spermidine/putrescine transport system permease subunit I